MTLSLLSLLIGILAFGLLFYESKSFFNYKPPLKLTTPSKAREPCEGKVLLVIIDGLRKDTAEASSIWQDYSEWASGSILTQAISLSKPCFANIITGTWQEFHSVTTNYFEGAIPVETIFNLTSQEFTTAFSGDQSLLDLIASKATWSSSVDNSTNPEVADQEVQKEAKSFLSSEPDLLIVHFSQVDHYSHLFGALSPQASLAIENVSYLLNDLLSQVDWRKYTIIVTSDHGHLQKGGHGGQEEEVVRVPILMAGQRVKKGVLISGHQIDIVPTICALTGTPVPAITLGEPLWDVLEIPIEQKAQASFHLLSQRVRFAQSYARLLGISFIPPELSQIELDTNNEEIFNQAEKIRNIINEEIGSWREEKIQVERENRLIAPILSFCLFLAFLIWSLRRGWGLAFLNSIITVFLFILFFSEVFGYSLSFSILSDVTFLTIFRLFGLPLLIAETLLLAFLPLQLRRGRLSYLLNAQRMLLCVSLILVLAFSFIYWLNGLTFSWHLPDFSYALLSSFILLEVIWNSIFALLLPLLFYPLWRFYS